MKSHLKSCKAIVLLLVLVLFLLIPQPVSAQSTESPPVVPAFVISPEILAAIAGAALSLAFSYLPGLNTKYAALETTRKKLIMAGLLAAVAAVVYGLGCGGILQIGLTCSKDGLVQLVWIYILAIMANQGVFTLTPQTPSVKGSKP